MFEPKRLMNEFTWVPVNARASKYDPITPLPPRKDGDRKALYWLSSGEKVDDFITSIYFVNSSTEILKEIIYSSSGMQTCDDDILIAEGKGNRYLNVIPGEAVKIDEYDEFFDSDILVGYYLTVVSDKLGKNEYSTSPSKRCLNEEVLLWVD